MNDLDEAWRWYEATRLHVALMQRLARRYWDDLPWAECLERDEHFKGLDEQAVLGGTALALRHLDDLAVVVLFSVFESTVRQHALGKVAEIETDAQHPILTWVLGDAREAIEERSFARVLEPYKSAGLADLVEAVNQVRRYRNWVAHGRRGKQPEAVSPRSAYERLDLFLRTAASPAVGPTDGPDSQASTGPELTGGAEGT